MEKQLKTGNRALVMTAMFAALSCTATMVIRIPSPSGGYMNLGDTTVLLGAYLLGPLYGAIAGGIGSALADLLSAYPMYVPGTLVIKGAMALAAGYLYGAGERRLGGILLAGAVGECIMVAGYWLYDGALAAVSGSGFSAAFLGSAAGIPSNLVQAGFGLAASTLLLLALRKNGRIRREFPRA